MSNLESVQISGVIAGTIWMPACLCWKNFSQKFTPDNKPFSREWNGLPDALQEITNDGDFSSCGVVDAYLVATYRVADNRVVMVQGEINLNAKALADFKASAEARDAYYEGDFNA